MKLYGFQMCWNCDWLNKYLFCWPLKMFLLIFCFFFCHSFTVQHKIYLYVFVSSLVSIDNQIRSVLPKYKIPRNCVTVPENG